MPGHLTLTEGETDQLKPVSYSHDNGVNIHGTEVVAPARSLLKAVEAYGQVVLNYVEVLKPRETSLIAFIGISSAFIAGEAHLPPDRLMLILAAILLGSAGVNGLTNYMDRHVDARMRRTSHRALASRRIQPAEKVLPLTALLVAAGLVLSWQLHPLVFFVALVGTVAALAWRKRWTCVFPQGILASCAPVLMGWFAVRPVFSWPLFLLCLLVAVWLPLHLWSVMIAHREDYLGAGIRYFPVSQETGKTVKLLFALSLALYVASLAAYFIGGFHWLYLVLCNLLGGVLLYTSLRLARSASSQNSWRLYKISAFPYMGLLFLAMCLDTWLLSG